MSLSCASCSTAAGWRTALSLLNKSDDLKVYQDSRFGPSHVGDLLELLGLLVEVIADGAAGDPAHDGHDPVDEIMRSLREMPRVGRVS